eukprot:COSAG01_NODE_5153_length_4449_cov_8.565287_1_plen_62_part_00
MANADGQTITIGARPLPLLPPCQFREPRISASVKLSSFSINPADQSRMHSVRSILQPPWGT